MIVFQPKMVIIVIISEWLLDNELANRVGITLSYLFSVQKST